MMDDSSTTSWDEFRLASSSFGTGGRRKATEGDDRRRTRKSLQGSTSTSSNSLRATSGGAMKRSTSNSINEKLVNALWSNTTTHNGNSRRGSDPASLTWSATADAAKVRQRMQKPGVGQFLRENREGGARMGRITSKGQFVPASIML